MIYKTNTCNWIEEILGRRSEAHALSLSLSHTHAHTHTHEDSSPHSNMTPKDNGTTL